MADSTVRSKDSPAAPPREQAGASSLLAIVLGLLFLCLRAAPIDHGAPRTYVPDSHVVRSALGMAQDQDLVPPVGKYSSYPYLMPYLLLPVFAAQYAAGKYQGEWQGPGEFALKIKLDPSRVHVSARAVVACLGALVPWVVFRAARAAGLASGAWFAAWLSGTGLLLVQFSTHERPWTLVTLCMALCAHACIVHARTASTRSLLCAAVWAGLALAAHQAGAFALGMVGLAWAGAVAFGPEQSGVGARRGLWPSVASGAAAVAVFLCVALLLGHAYYLRYGSVEQTDVVGGARAAKHFSIGGQALNAGFSFDSARRLCKVLAGYDSVLWALGLVGLLPALRHPRLRAVTLFAVLMGLFFLFSPSDHVRYFLPVSMLVCLSGGLVAQRLWTMRGALRPVLLAVLFLPAVQAARMAWVLERQDSRAQAEVLLAGLEPGSVVAIDHYGPHVELNQAALERLETLRGELRTRETTRLEILKAGEDARQQFGLAPGVDAFFVEDLFETDPVSLEYVVRPTHKHLGESPRAVLAKLGATHLLSVCRRGSINERAPLAELVRSGERVQVISPADGPGQVASNEAPREAFLPTEMDFPLTGLWQVERPGPYLELVRLP